jgi:hypothetical protein
MENVNNQLVDISFMCVETATATENTADTETVAVVETVAASANTMVITYDNEMTETLVIGKETYDKMYKEWLVEQPPFISDVYKQMMNNIILSSIHNNPKCIAELNGFFRVENKEEVMSFITYMRGRDLTQEKLKWNKPFGDLYNKGVVENTGA